MSPKRGEHKSAVGESGPASRALLRLPGPRAPEQRKCHPGLHLWRATPASEAVTTRGWAVSEWLVSGTPREVSSSSSDSSGVGPEAMVSILRGPGRRSRSCWGQDGPAPFQTPGPRRHENRRRGACRERRGGKGTDASAHRSGVSAATHTLPLGLPSSGHRPHPDSPTEMLQGFIQLGGPSQDENVGSLV